MDPFVEQLKRLCASYPTRAKWVFVPTHAVGRMLGDRLVLEGTDWANLRFVTPLGVALQMAGPFLVERGIDPSEEGLGPALMMRLLMQLPRPGYFRPLAEQPSLATALWSTVRELRMSGVRADDLKEDAFESRDKAVELRALLASYEAFLHDERRGDAATVCAEALAHVDWSPIQPQDCRIELPHVCWPLLQRRVIDALPGESIAPGTFAIPASAVPRRLRESRMTLQNPGSTSPMAFLLAPSEAAPDAAGAGPALFHAGGAEAEVEEVFRRILERGCPLDRVEIVCASPSYSTLLWEKAMRHEWPITMAHGLPAACTRPGRALLALGEWIEDDFSAAGLRRMLQSGDVRMDLESMAAGRAARLLVKSQAAWGRDTYRLALGRLARSSRTRAERDDVPADRADWLRASADQADALAAWIQSLIDSVPVPSPDKTIDLAALVTCARAFVTNCAARASALDALAATALDEAIADLASLGAFRCSIGQGLRFIRERVEHVHVGVDRARPGHLFVSRLADAGFSGRPFVFVVGLEEGRVFPTAFEDPVLLDAERTAIHAALPRSTDRIDESVYASLARLATLPSGAGGAVCLSFSCRDLREYRETFASWIVLQAFRVISGNPAARYGDLREHLNAPKSCVGSDGIALTEGRWWLRGAAVAGESSRVPLLARYPHPGAGLAALNARASNDFTPYDGRVPAAGQMLDPCRSAHPLSVTQLEDAAKCPFRHFVRRGLGVEAIEAGERDRDVWLDPLMRGSLLHDLYASLLGRCRDEKRRVDRRADGSWLRAEGERKLKELAAEMPPPSEEVRDRETRQLLDDLAVFVEQEAAPDSGRTPFAFEVSFGRSGSGDEDPLAHPDPVVISLGGGAGLKLAGRIDRIDRLEDGSFEILDYKTGGYRADDWKGTFAGGGRLQHALYSLAAQKLLERITGKPKIHGAQYYFSSTKGQQERKRFQFKSLGGAPKVLADLREVIASGLFLHAANEKACRFCDYGFACGANAAGRAGAKKGDPALAPLVKLEAHE